MRTLVALALLTVCLSGGITTAVQEVAFLDLTGLVPRHRAHEPTVGRARGGFAVRGDLAGEQSVPLRVTLLPLAKGVFQVGDEVIYEVSAENVSSSPIGIPWDFNIADIEPSDPVQRYEYHQVSISLWFTNAQNVTEAFQPVVLYSTSRRPESQVTLLPGQSARIRAKLRLSFQDKRLGSCNNPLKFLVQANLTLGYAKVEKRGAEYSEELTSPRPDMSQNAEPVQVLPSCPD